MLDGMRGVRVIREYGLPAGLTSATSTYRYVWIAPLTSGSWAAGDRGLYCVAYYRAPGVSWTEMTLTHSIKGSGG
jgi:hypothetical protein